VGCRSAMGSPLGDPRIADRVAVAGGGRRAGRAADIRRLWIRSSRWCGSRRRPTLHGRGASDQEDPGGPQGSDRLLEGPRPRFPEPCGVPEVAVSNHRTGDEVETGGTAAIASNLAANGARGLGAGGACLRGIGGCGRRQSWAVADPRGPRSRGSRFPRDRQETRPDATAWWGVRGVRGSRSPVARGRRVDGPVAPRGADRSRRDATVPVSHETRCRRSHVRTSGGLNVMGSDRHHRRAIGAPEPASVHRRYPTTRSTGIVRGGRTQ
jgi:hypothetical protein